ncbi:serine hydrolase [Streptomyces sp. NPDC090306]|uniref:serine hydrolase n=1 Tax=Streptomyces sp. NPDC090306 TaxID=3365961 RepID=UPI003828E42B
MDDNGIAVILQQAGCTGTLCVRSLDDGAEVAFRADEPAVSASVVKVQVALEVESRIACGLLDPRRPVRVGADDRTPGPTGISLFDDDAVVSLRDLVVLMLSISDNAATDVLVREVGVDTLNASAARLGLRGTVVVSDIRQLVDSVGEDIGFGDWAEATAWAAQASPDQLADADERLMNSRALDPSRATRTTARDMVDLLDLVWSDRAGPPAACARVRDVLARQLTRHRIASGFRPPVRVAAKSGSLMGVVRNEVGVVTFPDRRRYAAAVFTRTRPGADDGAVSRAIGTATARAVAALRGAEDGAGGRAAG